MLARARALPSAGVDTALRQERAREITSGCGLPSFVSGPVPCARQKGDVFSNYVAVGKSDVVPTQRAGCRLRFIWRPLQTCCGNVCPASPAAWPRRMLPRRQGLSQHARGHAHLPPPRRAVSPLATSTLSRSAGGTTDREPVSARMLCPRNASERHLPANLSACPL